MTGKTPKSEWDVKVVKGFVNEAPKGIRELIDTAKKQFGQSTDYVFRVQKNTNLQAPDTLPDNASWAGLQWTLPSRTAFFEALSWIETFATRLDDPKSDIVTFLFATIPTTQSLPPEKPTIMKCHSPFQGIAEFCRVIREESPAKRGRIHSCDWVMLECHRIG
jgi:hypothetical protein